MEGIRINRNEDVVKLRYQMRGLGIGIIVTALLMGVALDDQRPLSDAEIKLLAAELGMVEEDSLKLSDVQQSSVSESDNQQKEQDSSPEGTAVSETETPTEAPTEAPAPESTVVPTTEPTTTPTAEPTAEPTVAPTEEPTRESEDKVTSGTIITIVVKSGANSYSVSKQLAEAGLVESANVYDKYLCNNGYAERIQVGTFEIPMGSSQQEIAKIITKTR